MSVARTTLRRIVLSFGRASHTSLQRRRITTQSFRRLSLTKSVRLPSACASWIFTRPTQRLNGRRFVLNAATSASSSTSGDPDGTDPMRDGPGSDFEKGGSGMMNDRTTQEDSRIVFELIWNDLISEFGLENLVFPKSLMFLAGAPGSGKTEMTEFIRKHQDIHSETIKLGEILSELSSSKSFVSKGMLVGDRQVIGLLLRKLLAPEYRGTNAALIDGFPRTPIQAYAIGMLFDKMLWLRREFEGTPHFEKLRRPVFHVTVLYVDEPISIERQLSRGELTLEHNRMVEDSGHGKPLPVRDTDTNEEAARLRYATFKKEIKTSLSIVKEKFPFHFINAEGSKESIRRRIVAELEYQSEIELDDSTFEVVRQIPIANEVRKDARSLLVRRLDNYQREHPELFQEVIAVLKGNFMDIIKNQALAGQAIIRSEDPVFLQPGNGPMAVRMALDILSERGYRVVLDVIRENLIDQVDVVTGAVLRKERKIFVFICHWPKPRIRHAIAAETDSWETYMHS